MAGGNWEHYSHPSDVGIRGFGGTKEAAFEQAALALVALVAELGRIEAEEEIEIFCEEEDEKLLFAGWLNAIVYEMATRGMLFSRFEVSIEGERLRGKAVGERIDVKKHEPAVEVKAVTYMDLDVKREEDGRWVAQCIVDV